MKIEEKSVSIAQQRMMGQAYALKKGDIKLSDIDPEWQESIKTLADDMTLKDLEKFAKTKHDDLPDKVEESFKPHMMYDPKTGKGYKAEKPEDHEKYAKMGYTHEKPENVDESFKNNWRELAVDSVVEAIKNGTGNLQVDLTKIKQSDRIELILDYMEDYHKQIFDSALSKYLIKFANSYDDLWLEIATEVSSYFGGKRKGFHTVKENKIVMTFEQFCKFK